MCSKKMPFYLLFIFLSLFLTPTASAQYPKPEFVYINDFANIINDADEIEIRQQLLKLRTETGIHMVVTTINSIKDYGTDDSTIERFGTNLFNQWGIGDKNKNDGILLLVAASDRNLRIVLGDGYDAKYDDRMKTIIDSEIVPYFREDQYSAGILAGTNAIIDQVDHNFFSGSLLRFKQNLTVNLAALFGGGTALTSIFAYIYAQFRRNRKRNCPTCSAPMNRLSEEQDDLYLDSGQKIEEGLKSVDYDVWHCNSCNNHDVLAYNNWLSTYSKCKQCAYRTIKSSSRTLEQPTYVSSGRKEVTQSCRHCSYHDVRFVVLPRLEQIDTSSSSSGSSGGSSGGFGGGSSSGGGASGSW